MANVVVIGGSAAGMSFAAKYSRNNPDDNIILFEQRDYISFGACGLPYYLQNQFTDTQTMISRTPSEAIESGIDVRINKKVSKINEQDQTVEVDGEKIKYDKLILATGATPIVPPFCSVDNKHVFSLTTMEDGMALKQVLNSGIKHVTIVGAGFIGLEVMDAAFHLGLEVSLIEASPSILNAQFASDMSSIVKENIVEKQIDLQLNTMVEGIEVGDKTLVKTNQGQFETDVVVVAIGFKPNSSLVNCEKLPNGAVKVDEHGKTSLENIYAIGDVASVKSIITGDDIYLPLATNANKFAKSLADYLSKQETTFSGMLASACIKVLDYDLARTGLSEVELQKSGTEFKSKIIKDKTHTNYVQGNEDIYIKIIYCPKNYEIFGAQIVGKKDVVHRLNTLALAIHSKTTTKELAYVDFAYAPPFSRTWESINTAANVCK